MANPRKNEWRLKGFVIQVPDQVRHDGIRGLSLMEPGLEMDSGLRRNDDFLFNATFLKRRHPGLDPGSITNATILINRSHPFAA